MRHSLYWDDFSRRVTETTKCLKENTKPPIRRIAVFITEGCNFKCSYCNVKQKPKSLSQSKFSEVINKYGKDAIVHITGGEPSIVPWLYPTIIENSHWCRFNLNTNAYKMPPYEHIKRLKVSLDSYNEEYWDDLVGVKGAFNRVVNNIKVASKYATTSITYTLTKENFNDALEFADFASKEFPHLYALFFSVYKGDNPRFVFQKEDTVKFFNNVLPKLKFKLNDESLALLGETLKNKQRLISGVRFPDNDLSQECYLSMSERVIDPSGNEYTCSHLYRDNIKCTSKSFKKYKQCQYGCNQRLVDFNNLVAKNVLE